MEQTNHRAYTARDFEQYYSGKMPEVEMHALEKAALEDPFLADALEGYQYTSTPVEDIEYLEKRLAGKKKESRLFLLQNSTWFKVAAFIIVFAGAGYFIYVFLAQQPNQMVTQSSKRMVEATADSGIRANSAIPPDRDTMQKDQYEAREKTQTAATASDSIITAKAITPKKNSTVPSLPGADNSVSQINNDVAVNHKEQAQSARSLPAPGIKREALISSKAKDAVAANDTIIGQVMDDQGSPIPFASVTVVNKKLSTTADANGNFRFATSDSILRARIAAMGFKAGIYELAKAKNKPVVMQRDSSNLSEVVVTALGIKRNKHNRYSSVKLISVGDSLYGPTGGWQKFDDYISQNTTIQTNDSGKDYEGEIIISFEANKKGMPYSIKIDQSLCNSCDEEAKRLILQGPKWKYSNGKKYQITINF